MTVEAMPRPHRSLAEVALDRASDLGDTEDFFHGSGPLAVTFLNPASYLSLRRHPEIYEAIDHFCFDGISMSILLSCLKLRWIRRTSFDMTSLAPMVFDACAERGARVAVIGSTSLAVAAFVERMSARFERLVVAYQRNGYFDTADEMTAAIDEAIAAGTTVFVLGLGTPLQERFAAMVKTRADGKAVLAFTCGGFVHQTASTLHYYPKWVDVFHLRWAFRLVREPHTRGRFVRLYVMFPFVFLGDLLLSRHAEGGR